MYNRYIPQADGSYRKKRISDTNPPESEPQKQPDCPPIQPQKTESVKLPPPAPEPKPSQPLPRRKNVSADTFLRQLLPKNLDTGDLLIILLLLLMAGDNSDERNTAWLTLALYFIM